MTAHDPHPRFYVAQLSGYRIHLGALQAGNARLTTDFYVRDAWYCHRDVARFLNSAAPAKRLARAERDRAELNAEHDEEMAA